MDQFITLEEAREEECKILARVRNKIAEHKAVSILPNMIFNDLMSNRVPEDRLGFASMLY